MLLTFDVLQHYIFPASSDRTEGIQFCEDVTL